MGIGSAPYSEGFPFSDPPFNFFFFYVAATILTSLLAVYSAIFPSPLWARGSLDAVAPSCSNSLRVLGGMASDFRLVAAHIQPVLLVALFG